MAKYIDKSTVVAEIERRRDAALMRQRNLEAIGQETVHNEMVANELNRVITFINTLGVKEVDLEKEIDEWQGCKAFPEGTTITPLPKAMEIVERTAKHFFELGLKAQNG